MNCLPAYSKTIVECLVVWLAMLSVHCHSQSVPNYSQPVNEVGLVLFEEFHSFAIGKCNEDIRQVCDYNLRNYLKQQIIREIGRFYVRDVLEPDSFEKILNAELTDRNGAYYLYRSLSARLAEDALSIDVTKEKLRKYDEELTELNRRLPLPRLAEDSLAGKVTVQVLESAEKEQFKEYMLRDVRELLMTKLFYPNATIDRIVNAALESIDDPMQLIVPAHQRIRLLWELEPVHAAGFPMPEKLEKWLRSCESEMHQDQTLRATLTTEMYGLKLACQPNAASLETGFRFLYTDRYAKTSERKP